MKYVARKKIVFVIVEGPSDDEALGIIFHRLYDKNVVYLEIVHGDITSELSVTPKNIAAKIGDWIRRYAKSNHYKVTDFQEVIHLLDMDGVYVSDEAVVEDKEAEKLFYTTTEIHTAKPEQLRERNKRKRENINRICSMNKVWGSLPYCAYYMSLNLDHVLYNKLNSTNNSKEQDAYLFAKKYKDHLDDFLTFISDSDFSVCDGLKQSWEFIKTEKHSLERHTNLGICFREIREKRREGKEI